MLRGHFPVPPEYQVGTAVAADRVRPQPQPEWRWHRRPLHHDELHAGIGRVLAGLGQHDIGDDAADQPGHPGDERARRRVDDE